MSTKTHKTAVAVIPPAAIWRPIQAIRARHDRHVARWMPHITLLYPFRPREEFEVLAVPLAQACAQIRPFPIELAQFHFFDHGRGSYTLWLAPEPREPLLRLQEALMRVTPDCDDVARYEFGFTPHLSVGQVRGEEAVESLRSSLQESWHPLSFLVREVSLLWRNDPPNDVFRIAIRLPLGERT